MKIIQFEPDCFARENSHKTGEMNEYETTTNNNNSSSQEIKGVYLAGLAIASDP